ncbi:MAG: hypothetical protein OEL87_00850 [Nanoarchaeota archaeon]|nr:hypothetical protein [Nanoarchaeota archaeon]
MPSDERWRRFKIVVSINLQREEELVGGLKNAVERGSTLKNAMQSFINAGYSQAEIFGASQKVNHTNSRVIAPTNYATIQAPISGRQQLPTTPIPSQKEKVSTKLLIILISISVFILIGAAVLGIFWNRLF